MKVCCGVAREAEGKLRCRSSSEPIYFVFETGSVAEPETHQLA